MKDVGSHGKIMEAKEIPSVRSKSSHPILLRKKVTHFWGVFRECNLLGAPLPATTKERNVVI